MKYEIVNNKPIPFSELAIGDYFTWQNDKHLMRKLTKNTLYHLLDGEAEDFSRYEDEDDEPLCIKLEQVQPAIFKRT